MKKILNQELVIESLKKIIDPEYDMDIYTLGFIQEIQIDGRKISLTMTLSCPGCPVADKILLEVNKSLSKLGFKEVKVNVPTDSLWQPSEEVRTFLGV